MGKLSSKECKIHANEILKDRWVDESMYFLLYLVIHIIVAYVVSRVMGSEVNFNSMIANIVLFPLTIGYLSHIVDLTKGVRGTRIADMFKYYMDKTVIGYYLLNFTVGLVVVMWSILLIIPGIVASLSYAMCMYIKIEYPSKGIREIMKESKEIMRGNKAELVMLSLSLIGWQILGVVTVVGIIPVVVYSSVVKMIFYKNRRETYYGEINLYKEV